MVELVDTLGLSPSDQKKIVWVRLSLGALRKIRIFIISKLKKMQDNFNFKSWIMEHQTGPYSKDTADYGKKQINESIEEDMKLTPPSPENIYEPDPDYGMDQQERFLGLGGDRVISGIESLMDDGFDLEEIIDIIRQHFH